MISIPLSMGIGIILLNALGYNLNQLSIVGFVLALGLLVNDSIVVVREHRTVGSEGHRFKKPLSNNQSDWISGNRMHRNLDNLFFYRLLCQESSGDFIETYHRRYVDHIGFSDSVIDRGTLSFRKVSQSFDSRARQYFLKYLQKPFTPLMPNYWTKLLGFPVMSLIIALIIFIASLWMIPIVGVSLFRIWKTQFMIDIGTPSQSILPIRIQ